MMRAELGMSGSEERRPAGTREDLVRAELAVLIESAAFRTSKRCRAFLEYVVERTLKGEGATESLKERTLGVELFHLPPSFDASQHTIVRVTANEVRKRLAQHYVTGEGAPSGVRIEIPPGAYRAEFRWESPGAEARAAPPPPRRRRVLVAAAAGLLMVAGGATAWWIRGGGAAAPAARSGPASGLAASPGPVSGELRIIAGARGAYLDRSGRAWGPDRFFSGGTTVFRASERVLRTLDPDIYRHSRVGEFRYDIPLNKGVYQLHLHFAETGLADFISAESSGEGQRVFRVFANGKPILDAFDVVADAAGRNTANERVFRNIEPAADGFLRLHFVPMRGSPIVSAIQVLPARPGEVHPVRIRAGWTAAWQDSSGRQWRPDSFFLGGNALVRATNPAREGGAGDHAIYASERWGHFSYAIPVADGAYRVTLRFLEGHYGRRNAGGGGVGSRVFDVYCNGAALLRNFDIVKEAGGEGSPLSKTFSGIRPTAQGKIVLTFVPVKGMACVNGIEVVEEPG
jgi:hypothetical protein